MIKTYTNDPEVSFVVLKKDSRIIQLHNRRVDRLQKARGSILNRTKKRHKDHHDKIQEHMKWLVKCKIPNSSEWILQRLSNDSEGRYVLLYLIEDTEV